LTKDDAAYVTSRLNHRETAAGISRNLGRSCSITTRPREMRPRLREKLESPVDRQPMAIGILADRFTIDVLHREPRNPIIGHARVDERGDVRMLESRQHSPREEESHPHSGLTPLGSDPTRV
jgi:hypothetical protein